MHQLPRDLWRYQVPRLEVADLSTAYRLARVGLDPPTPGRKSWPSYQQVGETLWHEGWPGLLASSAARADGLVLCLFIETPTSLPAPPLPPPRLIREPPAPPTGMRT
jgi:hypothetical protein